MPGDKLILTAVVKKQLGGLFLFDVEADAGNRKIAKGTLALAREKS